MRNLTKNLLVAAGSLLVVALLAEFVLRKATGSMYTKDADLGWALSPKADAWDFTESKEHIFINSDGLRDREHSIEKPPDTLRIAVLGDSYAEAYNVPMEHAFWSVMESGLSSCPRLANKHVEVVNFGVSAYGTAQELLVLRKKVWKYSPDIVMLAFYSGNDFFNNYRDLNIDRVLGEDTPYFVYQNGNLALDDSFRRRPIFTKVILRSWIFDFRKNLEKNSLLVMLAVKAASNLKLRITQKQFGSKQLTANLNAAEPEDMVYSEPADPRMKEAWRVTEGIISTMNDEVRARGSEFWISVLANHNQLLPEEGQRKAFLQRLGIENPFYTEHRFRAFAERSGIPLVALALPMSEFAARTKTFLNGGKVIPLGVGHWNDAGHRVAGEILASDLCSCSQRLTGETGLTCNTDSVYTPASNR